MTLHLVTDRRRLSRSSDVACLRECLMSQAQYAARAGVDVIQIRERDLDARLLMALVDDTLRVVRGTKTRVVVNDRVDVALAAGAHGVHLPARGLPVTAVRALCPPGFVIGRSVHDVDELDQAAGADYVFVGTVWSTPSKPERSPLLGLEGLTRLAARASMPVLAIGGVDRSRLPDIARTGAAGAASIGLFMGPTPGTSDDCRAVDLTASVAEARRAFDTSRSGS